MSALSDESVHDLVFDRLAATGVPDGTRRRVHVHASASHSSPEAFTVTGEVPPTGWGGRDTRVLR